LHYDSNHPIVAKFETQVPAFNGPSKGVPGTGGLTHPDMGCKLVCGSSAEKVIFVTEPKIKRRMPDPFIENCGKMSPQDRTPVHASLLSTQNYWVYHKTMAPLPGAENLPAGATGASTVAKGEHHCLAEISASL
jgi:hypothetical protein